MSYSLVCVHIKTLIFFKKFRRMKNDNFFAQNMTKEIISKENHISTNKTRILITESIENFSINNIVQTKKRLNILSLIFTRISNFSKNSVHEQIPIKKRNCNRNDLIIVIFETFFYFALSLEVKKETRYLRIYAE